MVDIKKLLHEIEKICSIDKQKKKKSGSEVNALMYLPQ